MPKTKNIIKARNKRMRKRSIERRRSQYWLDQRSTEEESAASGTAAEGRGWTPGTNQGADRDA